MNKEKIALIGAERTEKQKNAAKMHSKMMQNRAPHNKKPVSINGVEYPSMRLAMKNLKIGYAKLKTMIDG